MNNLEFFHFYLLVLCILINKKIMKKYLIVRKKIILSNSIYHVIQRAPGDELLFKSDKDRIDFLFLVKKIIPKFNIELLAYSLMPNHIHLLIKTKEPNLSLCMKSLFEQYAKLFNRRHNRKGHVFHGVYRAVYCDSNFASLIVSFYIHLNAYKAKIIKELFEYKWDSLNEYSTFQKNNITDSEIILKLLNENLESAKSIYRKMILSLSSTKQYNIADKKEAILKFYISCSKSMKVSEFM